MQNAADQTDWATMYVYLGGAYKDLFDIMNEYLTEAEHADFNPPSEVSTDTVNDLEEWRERRRELLLKDFAIYLTAALE